MKFTFFGCLICASVLVGPRPPGPDVALTSFRLGAGLHSLGDWPAVPSADPRRTSRCDAREISRQPVTLPDSTQVYIEPSVLLAAGSHILLAGTPSYVWRMNGATSKLESRNQLFGVVLHPDGSARGVPRPAEFALAPVAATAIGDNSWVIFAELDSSKPSPDDKGVAALWYGSYDGTHWGSVERVPRPTGISPELWGASCIVRHSGSLGWALLVKRQTELSTTVFFQRTGGK